MNKNNLGNDELNKLIQSIWNPHNPEYEGFRVGDRVIQTVNNYDLNLYNGDIGWIAEINEKEEYLMVKFDQGLIKVNKTYIHDLKLAYSISVHKAQGSEFPVVVMPIALSHTFMLNRNLTYTAFTRAKQMIILVGSQRAMHIAVHKQFSERRNTELEQLIHWHQLRLS
jgi:exodeoxyribonuclease V alpha subunit